MQLIDNYIFSNYLLDIFVNKFAKYRSPGFEKKSILKKRNKGRKRNKKKTKKEG